MIECLETIGWTRRGVAARVGLSNTSCRRYEIGTAKVPDDIAAWLEKLAAAHERNPPPTR